MAMTIAVVIVVLVVALLLVVAAVVRALHGDSGRHVRGTLAWVVASMLIVTVALEGQRRQRLARVTVVAAVERARHESLRVLMRLARIAAIRGGSTRNRRRARSYRSERDREKDQPQGGASRMSRFRDWSVFAQARESPKELTLPSAAIRGRFHGGIPSDSGAPEGLNIKTACAPSQECRNQ